MPVAHLKKCDALLNVRNSQSSPSKGSPSCTTARLFLPLVTLESGDAHSPLIEAQAGSYQLRRRKQKQKKSA
jgi:hypothetical protein